MPFVFKRLVLFLSIAVAFAADKQPPFRPAPAGSYASKQTNDQVTVGVDAYSSGDKLKAAFGKLDPNQHGVLPVLVVIQNDSAKALRLDGLRAAYNGAGGNRVEATPSQEVRYLRGPDRPKMIPGPTGQIKIGKGKKNPLDAWEIEGRAFTAKMLAPGHTASGFFYFQTVLQRGSSIYLNGLAEAATGKELLYFEIPLQ
jgi:hypothetical protein